MPPKERIREPLFEMITVFRGDYPIIAVDQEVLQSVAEDDPKPFFTTLRIGKIGAQSRNAAPNGKPRLYGERAVNAMLQQVNSGLGGILGHKDPWDSEETLPVLRWMGAALDAEGTLWGKAYIPTYAGDVRTYLKDSMKFNSQVGTSIYGTAEFDDETGEVITLDLEGIDLVNAKRVGVTAAVDVPRVSAEMYMEDKKEEVVMDVIADEQAVELQSLSELATLTAERDALQSQLAEMTATLETVTRERDSARATIAEMESTILENTITALIAETVTLEPMRPLAQEHLDLLRELGKVTSKESAQQALSTWLEKDSTKATAQAFVMEQSGGNAIVGAGRDDHLPSETEAREMGAKFLPKK